MDSQKLLKELLSEALEQKGYNREKLSQMTGIPDRFIEAFVEGESAGLPAAPYVRGYLKKIASALDLDAEELWRMYEREFPPRSSGGTDVLPGNRFAIQTVNKGVVAAVAVGALVLLYLGINANRLIGAPSLTVQDPSAETSTATSASVTIDGVLGNASDALTINGETVYVDQTGQFSKVFPLDAGMNNFDITAKRFLGRSATVHRVVVYNPGTTPGEPITPSEPLPIKNQ